MMKSWEVLHLSPSNDHYAAYWDIEKDQSFFNLYLVTIVEKEVIQHGRRWKLHIESTK